MDRRTFLAALAAGSVSVACAEKSKEPGSGSDPKTVDPAQPGAAQLPTAVFALGVASGDPTTDRVMLWTRLVSDPLASDAGSPVEDVEVAFDVSADENFETLVVSGLATATKRLAHSLHVDVTGLEPNTWYFYRFRAGDQTSATGRTRTVPATDADVESFRFIVASCQDLQWGNYGAWHHAAAEPNLDAVLFLGDYIYETNFGDVSPDKSGLRVWANELAITLEDYRQRYAQTKSDPLLQQAHHAVPWLTTFDDHEVSNNYAGDVGEYDDAKPLSHDRRLAAYQAWYEHTPIRLDPEPTNFDSMAVHRTLSFGKLASTFVIETRQNADPAPCRVPDPDPDKAPLSDNGPGCDEMVDPERTNLGTEQENWLTDAFAASTTTWNILANPIMLAGLNIGTVAEPEYTRDAWDGYPAVRERVLTAIEQAGVSNPVIVTGDWHASFVLDVKQTPDAPTLMSEFVVSSISTVLFATDYTEANPHVRYFHADYGYGLVTVTPTEFRCDFKYIADVWDPDTPIARVDSWVVKAGEPEASLEGQTLAGG